MDQRPKLKKLNYKILGGKKKTFQRIQSGNNFLHMTRQTTFRVSRVAQQGKELVWRSGDNL